MRSDSRHTDWVDSSTRSYLPKLFSETLRAGFPAVPWTVLSGGISRLRTEQPVRVDLVLAGLRAEIRSCRE